jgi:hypothetical protein
MSSSASGRYLMQGGGPSLDDVVVPPSAMISALGRFAGSTIGETRRG